MCVCTRNRHFLLWFVAWPPSHQTGYYLGYCVFTLSYYITWSLKSSRTEETGLASVRSVSPTVTGDRSCNVRPRTQSRIVQVSPHQHNHRNCSSKQNDWYERSSCCPEPLDQFYRLQTLLLRRIGRVVTAGSFILSPRFLIGIHFWAGPVVIRTL